ncbi:MAG: hypothetical protein JWQ87_4300 [Candidatus Sulfotelmatobacter sp.]|nr:hypothetical protein [Candidatus Sulfotelmatobacter sp.]
MDITITLLTLARPMAITGLIGLSAESSSAPARGTDGDGVGEAAGVVVGAAAGKDEKAGVAAVGAVAAGMDAAHVASRTVQQASVADSRATGFTAATVSVAAAAVGSTAVAADFTAVAAEVVSTVEAVADSTAAAVATGNPITTA